MRAEFYVSGYASLEEEGIHRYLFDTEKKTIRETASVTGIESPSYMAVHPNGRVIYSGEKHAGEAEVVCYSLQGIEKNPVVRGKLPTGGISACHISLDSACEYLFAANYATGSIAVFALDIDGMLVGRTDFVQHEGSGADPVRQSGPHCHFIYCDWDEVYVCDLGLDTVFIYDFNRKTGKLTPTDRNIKTAPGDGPRHLDFHMAYPDKLYLITEMKNDVYVLHKKNDRYEVIQKISSIPKGCTAENTAAAIRFTMGGSRLLVSNRGDNSIAVFSVNHDGTLNAPVFSPSGGDGPRDINLIGDHSTGEYVISANQNSGEVVIYKLEDDNTLTYTGIRVQAGSPTCVVPAVL